MPTFSFPEAPHHLTVMLHAAGMLPYRFPWKPGASVLVLMPANFRCQIARPVSYYALFK